MILKLEIYLDIDFNEEVPHQDVTFAKEVIQQELLTEVKKLPENSGLKRQIEVISNSFEFLSQVQILERMRTKGK
jgi:hypothetical protein